MPSITSKRDDHHKRSDKGGVASACSESNVATFLATLGMGEGHERTTGTRSQWSGMPALRSTYTLASFNEEEFIQRLHDDLGAGSVDHSLPLLRQGGTVLGQPDCRHPRALQCAAFRGVSITGR